MFPGQRVQIDVKFVPSACLVGVINIHRHKRNSGSLGWGVGEGDECGSPVRNVIYKFNATSQSATLTAPLK